jgi:sortase A
MSVMISGDPLQSTSMKKHNRLLDVIQWTLIIVGLALLALWAGMRLHGSLGKEADIRRFEEARREIQQPPPVPTSTPTPVRALSADHPVDTSLWDSGRIEEYRESLEHDFDPPLAILRVPALELEVAVLAGTSELALNRGVGHIDGTSLPGEAGNVGIAGHRDGYFRGFKDISEGELIELETLEGTLTYVISDIVIVDPSDVWVLEYTEVPSLTLVTCYPFYFVGSAPKRFIVRAEFRES